MVTGGFMYGWLLGTITSIMNGGEESMLQATALVISAIQNGNAAA